MTACFLLLRCRFSNGHSGRVKSSKIGLLLLDILGLSADFFARFAALRPSKPKTGFHPNTRKPRVLGSPGLLGAAAREPTA